MNVSLAGKVALVTGASSGIGRGTALALAAAGASVVVADRTAIPREGGPPTADAIAEAGGTAAFVACDVTNRSDVAGADAVGDSLGGVDVLVNNAGVIRPAPFFEATDEDLDLMLSVNVKGTFITTQVVAAGMVARGRGGSVVNIASVAGLRGAAGIGSYAASKGAVRLLTSALADELGPSGIRVNSINPGLIDTVLNVEDVPVLGTPEEAATVAQVGLRRVATPREVGDAVLFLASGLASYVNGASLTVDGGLMRF